MRLVTYGAACSLDGFIAGPKGEIDWLLMTADAGKVMAEYWPRIDTVLMGRKTWEQAAAMGGAGGSSRGISTFVFSRTLSADPAPGVTLVKEDAGSFVRTLKGRKGKDICVMGGGDFARSLFEAGVIDEVGINVHPILLGSGVPLFLDPGRRVKLRLTECRQMQKGCVLLMYRTENSTTSSRGGKHGKARV